MKSVVVGSVVTLMLFTSLIVSQVEAKTDNHDDKGKNKQLYKFEAKHDKQDRKYQIVAKNYKQDGNGKSVPIPGTLLLLGGGLVGMVAWRARQRKPQV